MHAIRNTEIKFDIPEFGNTIYPLFHPDGNQGLAEPSDVPPELPQNYTVWKENQFLLYWVENHRAITSGYDSLSIYY